MSEEVKVTNLGNTKTPHKPSTHINFHYVTLGDVTKASSLQFDFGNTPNVPSNNGLIDKYRHTDNYGDTYMILTCHTLALNVWSYKYDVNLCTRGG